MTVFLKVIGGALIILSGYGVGDYLKKTLDKRLCQLSDIITITSFIHDEIEYLACDFQTIRARLISEIALSSLDFLKIYSEENSLSPPSQWKMAVELSNLDATDRVKHEFLSIGDIIGSYPKEVQLNKLRLIINFLEGERLELKEYINSHGAMYKKLSVLLSVAILIILI